MNLFQNQLFLGYCKYAMDFCLFSSKVRYLDSEVSHDAKLTLTWTLYDTYPPSNCWTNAKLSCRMEVSLS